MENDTQNPSKQKIFDEFYDAVKLYSNKPSEHTILAAAIDALTTQLEIIQQPANNQEQQIINSYSSTNSPLGIRILRDRLIERSKGKDFNPHHPYLEKRTSADAYFYNHLPEYDRYD